jgi:mono/diheme cytochrome c family protein
MKQNLQLLAMLALIVCIPGCSKKEKPAAYPAYVDMVPGAEYKWNQLCVTCHGNRGEGDGPAGRNLKPRPRSFGEDAWQEGITDEQIKEIIVKGGLAVNKSKDMPPNPELEGNERVLNSLLEKVRSFRRP